MNLIIILITSLLVFEVVRIFFIFLYQILNKIFKAANDNIKFDLGMSMAFYYMYTQGFIGAVNVVMNNSIINNLEWYFIYTFIGVSSMLWCYFSWEMKFRAKPKFGANDKQVIVKKIIVFASVMIFSFYHGYSNLNKTFSGQEVDPLITIVNITVIPGVIALDRLLNQIKNFRSIKE